MGKALVTDWLRLIRSSFDRFLAILTITALGVAFFVGMRASAPDMRITAQAYFEKNNFMDVQVVSTLGLDDDDIEEIKKVPGVLAVMPAYSADVHVFAKDSSYTVKLHSMDISDVSMSSPSYMNRPILLSGRMPENEGECIADKRFVEITELGVGSEVTFFAGGDSDISDMLTRDTFTIVGIAESPLYVSYDRGVSSIGTGEVNAFFILDKSAFAFPAYTDVYITVENDAGLSRFDAGYEDFLKPVESALEKVGERRAPARLTRIKTEAQQEIGEGKAEIADAEAKLAEAEAELADAEAELAAGKEDYAKAESDFKKQIASAKRQLRAAQEQYEQGVAEADAAEAGLAVLREQIAMAEAGLLLLQAQRDVALAAIKALDVQIAEANGQLALLTPGSAEYEALAGQIAALTEQRVQNASAAEGLAVQIAALTEQISAMSAQLAAGEAQLAQARQELALAYDEIEASKRKLSSAEKSGRKELDEAAEELASAEKELADARAEYMREKADAEAEIADAKAAIEDAERELAELEEPRWYVFNLFDNSGFSTYLENTDRIDAISRLFPAIFFIVAALVSLTTMTRLVENDRGSIGTLTALGYGKTVIALKYLLYAFFASSLGSVLGIMVGFNLFPRLIYTTYSILYKLGEFHGPMHPQLAVSSAVIATACVTVPALLATLGTLMEPPSALMRPKTPRPGKRIFLEQITFIWSRMSFLRKVTARNIFRYKRRLVMTVLGMAGCTALVFTGFGLRDSIMTIVSKQFDDVWLYDMTISMKDGKEANPEIYSTPGIAESLGILQKSAQIWVVDGQTKQAYLVVPENAGEVSRFIRMRDRVTKKPYTLTEDSVIITEKLAQLIGASEGDTVSIELDGRTAEVKVAGISENYVFHYIYMAPETYKKLLGDEYLANQILCRLDSTEKVAQEAVSEQILRDGDVAFVFFASRLKGEYVDMLGALEYVVLVLLVSAATLAFVVLFSLTSINIEERRRELATIKVLGFYNRELNAYIYRENIVLTLMGTAFGLLGGVPLLNYVISTAEIDMVMFSREVLWTSYAFSVLLTFIFAYCVNAIMRVRLRRIDMVSSLKSAE